MLQPLVESMEVEMAEMGVEVKALVINKNLLTGTKTTYPVQKSKVALSNSPMKYTSRKHTNRFSTLLDIRLSLVVLTSQIIL